MFTPLSSPLAEAAERSTEEQSVQQPADPSTGAILRPVPIPRSSVPSASTTRNPNGGPPALSGTTMAPAVSTNYAEATKPTGGHQPTNYDSDTVSGLEQGHQRRSRSARKYDEIRGRLETLTELVAQVVRSSTTQLPPARAETNLALCQAAIFQQQPAVLPRFDGTKHEAWLRFETAYRHLEAKKTLPEQLIDALNVALEGEAYRTVEHYLITRTEPTVIVERLKSFYGDPKRIMAKLTTAILSRRPLTGMRDPNLREFALQVQGLVTRIQYYGFQHELKSVFLHSAIVGKMSDEQAERWYQRNEENPDMDLVDLSEFLMQQARLSASRKEERPLWEATGSAGRQNNLTDGHEGDATSQESEDIDTQLAAHFLKATHGRCVMCSGDHTLNECVLFLTRSVAERYNFVLSKNLCHACLLTNRHQSKDCPAKKKCTFAMCTIFHHPLLHRLVLAIKTAGNNSTQPNHVPSAGASSNGQPAAPAPPLQ